MNALAGWYPDPHQEWEHRYWDGATWTEYVANAGYRAVDPIELNFAFPAVEETLWEQEPARLSTRRIWVEDHFNKGHIQDFPLWAVERVKVRNPRTEIDFSDIELHIAYPGYVGRNTWVLQEVREPHRVGALIRKWQVRNRKDRDSGGRAGHQPEQVSSTATATDAGTTAVAAATAAGAALTSATTSAAAVPAQSLPETTPAHTHVPATYRAKIVILLSGTGSLAQSVIEVSQQPDAPYEVVAVIADWDAPGLKHAENANIPTQVVHYALPLGQPPAPERVDQALRDAVRQYNPDLVVSAGFMRILREDFLATFEGKTINAHPSLLPAFPGAHAVADAVAHGVKVTGATVHWVDAGVDTGKIIAQVPVLVLPGDTQESLHERIKVAERELLVAVVRELAATVAPTGSEGE